MVPLLNIVNALIFCMICRFSNGVAEKDSKSGNCSERVCQEASNPFDITRNDPASNLKNSKSYETNPGDMFRDISGHPNVKKVSEVHDNGFYTSLCWIEITTITEIKNGSKSAIREYAITFETPSDIPEKYISKKSESVDGETTQYKIFDRDTRKSEVVNFTTVSKSKESIVRQNKKVLCGSGPVYTKEFMEWPHSDKKRVEIRVSPKRQNLVASDCIVLNANVENISTLSPTSRDFDGASNEPLTGEGSDEKSTMTYPTPQSRNKITIETKPARNEIKENGQTKHYVNAETTIQGMASSPTNYKTLPHESTIKPKADNQKFKSDTFKPNKTFTSVIKLPKQPMHLKKSDLNLTPKPPTNEEIQEFLTKASTSKKPGSKGYEHLRATKNFASENSPQTSVARFQSDATIKTPTIKINNKESVDKMIDDQNTHIENQTENYHHLHSTKFASNVEDTLLDNKDTTEVLEHDSGVTETPKNIEFAVKYTELPLNKISKIAYRISSTTGSDKNQVKPKDFKLKYKPAVAELGSEFTFNPDFTPHKNQVKGNSGSTVSTYWKRSTKYTAATEQYNIQFKPKNKHKLVLSTISQEPQKISLLPEKLQDLPITERNVAEKESQTVPLVITANYGVSFVPAGINATLNNTPVSFLTPNKSSVVSTTKHPEFIKLNSFVTDGFIGSELSSLSQKNNSVTTEKSITATDKTTGKITKINLKTNPDRLSAGVSFNTPATKQLKPVISLSKFVTTPAIKSYTKILKKFDQNSLKENIGQGESIETYLKSSTTERIRFTSTGGIKKNTTVNNHQKNIQSYSPKTVWETLPSSTPFSASSVTTVILLPSSDGFFGSQLNSIAKNDNPITSKKSIVVTDKTKVKLTTSKVETKPDSLPGDVTFNTRATKALKSVKPFLKFVTRPAMKSYTKILKNIDQNSLKEDNGQSESIETYLKNSSTEKIEVTSIDGNKKKSTVNQYPEKIKSYPPKAVWEALPSSTPFSASRVVTDILLPSSTGFFRSELSSISKNDNPITTKKSTIVTDKTTVKVTTINQETKPDTLPVGDTTFNTHTTKQLQSRIPFLQFVTRPAMKSYTNILKNFDQNSLKENNGQGESIELDLKSSTTERIGFTNADGIKNESTVNQYQKKIKSYSPKASEIFPTSIPFSTSDIVTGTIPSSYKNENFAGNATTSQNYKNEDLSTYTAVEVPDAFYSSIVNHFTGDLLGSSLDSTTNYEILEQGQIKNSAAKQLRSKGISFLKFETTPATQLNTKIIKKVDQNSLKENNGKNQTFFKSSTNQRIGPTSTVDIKGESTVSQYEEKVKSNIVTEIVLPSFNNKNFAGRVTTSQSYTNEDLHKATHTTIKVPDTYDSPTDILESSLKSTTKYDIVKHEQTVEMFSQLPYIASVSDAKGLLDQTQHVTKDLEFLKSPLSQVKPSQKPINNNTINGRITSAVLPDQFKNTTTNELQPGPTVVTASHLLQKYSTVPKNVPDKNEKKIKGFKMSKPGHMLTYTPELISKNHISNPSKSLSGQLESSTTYALLQPEPEIRTVSYLPDKHSTETLLGQTHIKNRVSETYTTTLGNVQQSKDNTERSSKLKDITHSLSNLSNKNTTESTIVTNNLLDQMRDTKKILNTSEFVKNTELPSFYGPFSAQTSSDIINSESAIHQSKSTPKQLFFTSTAGTFTSLSNVLDGTYTQTKSLKKPVHTKKIKPFKLTVSDINTSLYDSTTTTTTKSKQNTYSVNAFSIGYVTTSENLFNKSPLTFLNETRTTNPADLKIKMHAPEKNTDTYFSATVSDNHTNSFQNTTKIRENLLNEKHSTTERLEKPTHMKTEISSKPMFSYTVTPESTTDSSEGFNKYVFLKPEENGNYGDLYFTTSKIPSGFEYIPLKSTQKTYSNVPNVYPNGVYFTSTEILSDQFGHTAATFKHPRETVSIKGAGFTKAEKILLGQHQSTTENLGLKQTFYSKSSLKHLNHTTSTERITSKKLLNKYQNGLNYLPLSQKAYSGLTLKYPTIISSIEDSTSSEKSVDVFHATTSRTNAEQKFDPKHATDTFSTRGFASSERLLDHYQSTTKDTQLKPKVSSKIYIKFPSDTSSTEQLTSSEKMFDLFRSTTQRIKLAPKAYSRLFPKYFNSASSIINVTSPQSLLSNQFPSISKRPHHHPQTSNFASPENPTYLGPLSDQFQSTTEHNNLKPDSKVSLSHPMDTYTVKDFTSTERPLKIFRSMTKNMKNGHQHNSKIGLSHPSNRYSTEGFTSSTALIVQPQNSTKLKFKEKHFTSGFLTIPLKHLNKFQDHKNLNDTRSTNFEISESNNIQISTEPSTDKLTHILKSLDKSPCNNTKQKILVRVKILMEHILEENESGTIRKEIIPLMGVEKKTEFDIKPKKQLPVVPHKKLNNDWNIFLDDLAKNFFDFNKHVVQDYTELKPKNLNLNVSGYEFGGDILSPRESIQRMQSIRNSMSRCKHKHGNQDSRGLKFISQAEKNNIHLKNRYIIDNPNKGENLKLTTKYQDNFYRFLLGSPSSNAHLEVTNIPSKVEKPSKLLLPFSEQPKIKIVQALNDWQRKPNIVLRNTEYITPIPGSYRAGYKQFALSDLFPISSKSERVQYIPTIIYHTAPKIVPEIFRPYPYIKDYDIYNVLSTASSSHNVQIPIDIAPRIKEHRNSGIKNSQYATSIPSSFTKNVVDSETAAVKTFKRKQKANNDNLKRILLKQVDGKSITHANDETFNFTLGKLSNNLTEEMNNFSSHKGHNVMENSNPDNSGYQESEESNFNLITENYKSEHSTHHKLLDFRRILDGIINKLNTLLEKLSRR